MILSSSATGQLLSLVIQVIKGNVLAFVGILIILKCASQLTRLCISLTKIVLLLVNYFKKKVYSIRS